MKTPNFCQAKTCALTFLLTAQLFVVPNIANGQNAAWNTDAVGIGGTNNSAFGVNSMTGVTSMNNTAVGFQSLSSLTLGKNNSALGSNALFALQIGIENSAFGFASLQNNISSFNLGFGAFSLHNNTSGSCNTALGSYALYSNSTASYNVAIGDSTLFNSQGTGNVGVGKSALFSTTTGFNNTAIGNLSLYNNTTGLANVAGGFKSLYNNTTGNANVAVGNGTLRDNLTGNENVAIGNSALQRNTSGSQNIAIGYAALARNLTPTGNIAIGTAALYWNTIGVSNNAYGYTSLTSNNVGSYNSAYGDRVLIINTSGSYNTSMGYYSQNVNTTGSQITTYGYQADVNNANYINATAIGANAIATASDKIVIGNNPGGGITIGGFANWSTYSDGRFKENVKENVPGLEFILNLRPVTYYVNVKGLDNHILKNLPDSIRRNRIQSEEAYNKAKDVIHTGFIAQEVEKVAKDLGFKFDGVNPPKNDADHYSLSYGAFVVPLVQAVKEQQREIESLKVLLYSAKNLFETPNELTGLKVNQNEAYYLGQNQPNPFNKSTTIKFQVIDPTANCRIAIYDLSGAELRSYVITKGQNSEIIIEKNDLKSGLYLYALIVNGAVKDVKKMVIEN